MMFGCDPVLGRIAPLGDTALRAVDRGGTALPWDPSVESCMYMGTSLIRNSLTPWDHRMALGVVLM